MTLNKYLIFIFSLLCLYSAPKAQYQVLQAQDLEIKEFHEISGHIFVIASIHGDDSCRYFLLNTVHNDFYLITGLCKGDEAMSRYISDEDLRRILEVDTEQRHKQQNPEKSNRKSEDRIK